MVPRLWGQQLVPFKLFDFNLACTTYQQARQGIQDIYIHSKVFVREYNAVLVMIIAIQTVLQINIWDNDISTQKHEGKYQACQAITWPTESILSQHNDGAIIQNFIVGGIYNFLHNFSTIWVTLIPLDFILLSRCINTYPGYISVSCKKSNNI